IRSGGSGRSNSDGTNWLRRASFPQNLESSPSSQTMTGPSFGDGIFVAVGQYGQVEVSCMDTVLQVGRFQPNAGFQLLPSLVPFTVSIQASSNMVDWTTIQNYPSRAEPVPVLDTTATNLTHRFYRTVWPQQ